MKPVLPDTAGFRKATVINRIVTILQDQKPIEERLRQVCAFIPEGFSIPEEVSASIAYDGLLYSSPDFTESQWLERFNFITPDSVKGVIELHFSAAFMEKAPAEYLAKDDHYLKNIAGLITGVIATDKLTKLLYDNTERLKELKGIRRTTEILSRGNSIEESLQEICSFFLKHGNILRNVLPA